MKKLKQKFEAWLNKQKKLFALIITASGILAIAVTYIAVITPIQFNVLTVLAAESHIIPIKAEAGLKTQNLTPQEHIWRLLDQYGLTLEEKIKAVAIIDCESKFDQYAIGVNKDGSKDLGIWQTNEKHQKISRNCAFDIDCQTEYVMNQIYLKQKNWSAWTCSR